MKKFLLSLTLLFCIGTGFAQMRIAAVYGAGGNTGATYNQDFVVIFNAGSSTVNLNTYSLQYASSAGSTWAAVNLSGNIAPGGYYLIALFHSTTNGVSLPLAANAANISINLSGSAGKVALVSSTTLLNGTNACSNINVVDVLGYGSTATCFEGSPFITTGITNAQCIKRSIDCTDNNNNLADFSIVSVNTAIKNSSSTPAPCTSSVLTVSPNSLTLNADLGQTATGTFSLSGANLTGAPGNLTVSTAAPLEVSTDGISFSNTASVPYSSATLTATTITVRLSASAPAGALNGTVTCSGAGATNAVVTINGGVTKSYFSKATGNLTDVATWGDLTTGSGASPTDFTTAYQKFIFTNRSGNTTLTAPWSVTGASSRIQIGVDNEPAISLTTAATNDTIDRNSIVTIDNNGTLILGNRIPPTFIDLNPASTVNYAYNAGTERVNVQTTAYGNLVLTGGNKYFSAGTTTVNTDLTMDNCVTNGSGSPFSTIYLRRNLSMQNGASFEDSTTGFANRLTLQLGNFSAGNNANILDAPNTDIRIFRLTVDTVGNTGMKEITVTPNSFLTIGNASGGDLRLFRKAEPGQTTNTVLRMENASRLAIVKNASIFTDATRVGEIRADNCDIVINKSGGATTAGTLKFTSFANIENMTINITTATRDSITIENNFDVYGQFDMLDGKIVMASGQQINLTAGATTNGGNTGSFVDGKISKTFFDPGSIVLPLGNANKYAPLYINPNFSGANTLSMSARYLKTAYSNLTVNPTTLASMPTYAISDKEYWDITRDAGTANPTVRFYYDAASSINNANLARIAHFNGTDWDDIGRDANGSNSFGTYIEKSNISSLSPFTFGSVASVLPIQLGKFAGQAENNGNSLQWQTTCEDAGDKFELQYSKNGTDFETIYTVDAIGTCTENNYSYRHNTTNNKNYYRLLMLNNNGSKAYSKVLILNNSKQNFEFAVQNNLSNNLQLNISSSTKANAIIQITNVNGQTVFTKTLGINAGSQQLYLPMPNVAKGIFYVTYSDSEGNRISKAVVL
jgi:hypothetical protein